jgi:hypothetical protein
MKHQQTPPSQADAQKTSGAPRARIARLASSLRGGLRVVLPVALLLLATAYGGMAQEARQAGAYAQLPPGKQIVKIRFAGDYLQLDALAEAFQAEILRQESPFLFLQIDPDQLPELRRQGYAPELVDPKTFFVRLVRLESPSDKHLKRVREIGGELIQREAEYAVFRLTVRQLDILRRENIAFRPIQEGDLVPRFVHITAPDAAAVELVVSVGVDIFEARHGVILGRAFDGQIDTLRRHGLQVKPTSPPSGPKQ